MIILIILIIVIIIGLIFVIFGLVKDESLLSFSIGCIVVSVAVCYIGKKSYLSPKPTALDVYRGKTTLQITYKDSIPIDSVVVFK